MDANITELEGHLKKHIVKTVTTSVISACILAVGIGIAFYYNTNFSIEKLNSVASEHSHQIEILNSSMQNLTNAITKSGTPLEVHSVQIQNLEKQVAELKSDVKDVNQKLDILLTRK